MNEQTNIEKLIETRNIAVEDSICGVITLYIHMPEGETEIIINPMVDKKIEYLKKAYDENLVHKNCKDIYITAATFQKDLQLDTEKMGVGCAFCKLEEGPMLISAEE